MNTSRLTYLTRLHSVTISRKKRDVLNFLVKSQYDSQPHLKINYFSNKISFLIFSRSAVGAAQRSQLLDLISQPKFYIGQLVVFEKYSGKSYRGEFEFPAKTSLTRDVFLSNHNMDTSRFAHLTIY